MTYFVSITPQGQMSVPVAIRRQLGIRTGEQVTVRVQDKRMIVEPIQDILSFRGIFKTKKKIPFSVTRKAFEEALGRGEA